VYEPPIVLRPLPEFVFGWCLACFLPVVDGTEPRFAAFALFADRTVPDLLGSLVDAVRIAVDPFEHRQLSLRGVKRWRIGQFRSTREDIDNGSS
jgi:hypothetical protein